MSAEADVKQGPLSGRTIVVTRSREQASALSRRLRELGATVIEIPTIAIVPPHSYEPLDTALRQLRSYDWLIVTSANTARVLGERLESMSLKLTSQPRTVAVGPSTAAALKELGLRVDLVPQPAVAESIVEALRDQVRGKRVLLARAEVARDIIPETLAAAGAEVILVDAYRTVLAEASAALVAATFGCVAEDMGVKKVKIDALTFTSSSTVTNLTALLTKTGCRWPLEAKVFSIGPVTSSTLREHGVKPSLEAARHDVDGLVDAVLKGLRGKATPS